MSLRSFACEQQQHPHPSPTSVLPQLEHRYVATYPDFRLNDEVGKLYNILSEKKVRIVVSPAKKCLGSIYDAEREKLEALGRDLEDEAVDAVMANYIMAKNARVGRDVVVLTSEVVEAKSVAKKYLDFVRVPLGVLETFMQRIASRRVGEMFFTSVAVMDR